ncbi:hypothetical protein UM396_08610 [Geobacillus subterraneus]|uniref:hypothetical protein n=1 Tax=Geobacillus subterraneus TaxID=129338 RepID=UPI000654E804|nr:hypothetical protein [Geobacillus subterraneus]AKM18954.1 hypothetical protein GARCT_01669 [Geobacillus sp. 12AMOR1]WJQ15676.1 hypothetical protein QT238_09225 [Geobacillus stearothermophilus]WPZ19934.1 hypothetical protein UM396_08610 [Geobacillus subterraneus]
MSALNYFPSVWNQNDGVPLMLANKLSSTRVHFLAWAPFLWLAAEKNGQNNRYLIK